MSRVTCPFCLKRFTKKSGEPLKHICSSKKTYKETGRYE